MTYIEFKKEIKSIVIVLCSLNTYTSNNLNTVLIIGQENSAKKTKRNRGHSVVKVKQIGGELKMIEENCGILKLCDKLVQSL